MKKRLVSFFTSLLMIFSLGIYLPAMNVEANCNLTADEAISWVNSKVGKKVDNGQCVGLIYEYYEALGVNRVYGNGCDFVTNSRPTGWRRIQGAVPQKGDILIWTGSRYGHVAIYESDQSTYHQNWNGQYVQKLSYFPRTYNFAGETNTYWGVIRPDFGSGNNSNHIHGYVDLVEGKNGSIRIKGWAYDEDAGHDENGHLNSAKLHVYFNDKFAGEYITSIDRSDVNDSMNIKGFHGFDLNISTDLIGKVKVNVYALNVGDTGGPQLLTSSTDTSNNGEFYTNVLDGIPPEVKTVDFETANIGSLGFVVTAKATDKNGFDHASFAVWTKNNGQDDLKWYDVSVQNDSAWAYVPLSNHKNEYGTYIVHAYFWDKANNNGSRGTEITINRKNIGTTNKRTIKDGVYTLKNGSGNFMDVTNAGSENGTLLQNYTFNGTVAQQMKFVYQGNGNYLIYPACGKGKVVDIMRTGNSWSGAISQGNSVDIYDTGDDEAQLFKVIPLGENRYALSLASKQNYVIGGTHNFKGSGFHLQDFTNYSNSCKWTFCDLSGKEIDPEYHEHTFGSWTTTKPATCTTDGTQTRKCSICGKSETKTIAKTGHKYTTKVTKQPTCTAEGTRTTTCSSCGNTYTASIPKTGHSYTTKVVAPTYTAQGYTLHTCKYCGKSYKDNYKPKKARTSISSAKISVSAQTYTGKALKPNVTVKLGSKTLRSGTDYTVSYKNNKNTGKATVTVTGKNAYIGTKSASFIIKPKKATLTKVTSPKTKQVKLTWKKDSQATGYQLQVALNKKFTSGKNTVNISKNSTTAKTIKSLKKGKKYYARVRAYKTVGKTKYYGSWSALKTVKCK